MGASQHRHQKRAGTEGGRQARQNGINKNWKQIGILGGTVTLNQNDKAVRAQAVSNRDFWGASKTQLPCKWHP